MEIPVQQLPHVLQGRYLALRQRTIAFCESLEELDYNLQPIEDVSPLKWHLAHTTWFFETFVLAPNLTGYRLFDERFPDLFNSYYIGAGKRWQRARRSDLSRPAVQEVLAYRQYVDAEMQRLLEVEPRPEVADLIELGCQHEEQHQELMATDLKYSLSLNPLNPAIGTSFLSGESEPDTTWTEMSAGLYEIGFSGEGFAFDNERQPHQVYLPAYRIRNRLVTVQEYLQFMQEAGYRDYRPWLSEGWNWVEIEGRTQPLYWEEGPSGWTVYTLNGRRPLAMDEPAPHLCYYEAEAFATWAGYRLPTEFEWEAASDRFTHGRLWEWTGSAYLPYPGFQVAPGTLGEYNGKWMINQMVLRGGSAASPPGHVRPTYRNFFHPDKQWQFSGVRLAQHL